MITNRQKKHKGVTVRTIVASTLVISMLTVSVLTALPGNSPAIAKIKIQPPKKHSSAYIKGYLMGCNDGQDQRELCSYFTTF